MRTAPFSHRFEIRRMGIRHDTVMPGWRSSQPHAERDEEEMVFILEGTPDLWTDGTLYRMKPGEAAGWPGRDGMAHCLINNTDKPVRMLTIGEASRYSSKIHFPLTRDMDDWLKKLDKLWTDPPQAQAAGRMTASRTRCAAARRRKAASPNANPPASSIGRRSRTTTRIIRTTTN